MAQARGLLVDTVIVIGLACKDDRFTEYAQCVANRARNANLRLYIFPHTLGEAYLVLNNKGDRKKKNNCNDLDKALSKWGIEVIGYSRSALSALFYGLSHGRDDERKEFLDMLAESIQYHGVSDVLLVVTGLIDDRIRGIVTTERNLLRSPLLGVLAEILYTNKPIGPAPIQSLSLCEDKLPA